MKKDIFNGKIKKEYFSYILVYTIFFFLLFAGTGGMCIYASFRSVASGFMLAVFGSSALLLAFVFLFLELLVIFRFPKHEKLRRILFNSDCYFVGADSNEYRGGNSGITWRARTSRRFFDLNKTLSEAESKMGDKKPVRYTVYLVLMIFASVLGLVWLIAVPFLFENGAHLSQTSEKTLMFYYISVAVICMVFALYFLSRALIVAVMSPTPAEKHFEIRHKLFTSLVEIAVRKNNKKRKFWFNVDQLEKIENLVSSCDENAVLEFERNGDKLISFKVVDAPDGCVLFNGLFL